MLLLPRSCGINGGRENINYLSAKHLQSIVAVTGGVSWHTSAVKQSKTMMSSDRNIVRNSSAEMGWKLVVIIIATATMMHLTVAEYDDVFSAVELPTGYVSKYFIYK